MTRDPYAALRRVAEDPERFDWLYNPETKQLRALLADRDATHVLLQRVVSWDAAVVEDYDARMWEELITEIRAILR